MRPSVYQARWRQHRSSNSPSESKTTSPSRMVRWVLLRRLDDDSERALGLRTYVGPRLHCGVKSRHRFSRQDRVVRRNGLEGPGHIDDLADFRVIVLNDAVIRGLCGSENEERPHGAQQHKTETLHLSLLEILLCRVTAQNRMSWSKRLASVLRTSCRMRPRSLPTNLCRGRGRLFMEQLDRAAAVTRQLALRAHCGAEAWQGRGQDPVIGGGSGGRPSRN